MIKLIALDLDGTLLKDDKTISDRNVSVLKQAKQKGVHIVICTGRPLFAIHSHIERLGLQDKGDYSITFNGSTIQRNDTGETLVSHAIAYEDVCYAYDQFKKLDLPLDIVSNDTMIHLPTATHPHQSIYEEMNPLLKVEHHALDTLEHNRVFNKLVVAVNQDHLDSQIKCIPLEVKERFSVMKSRPNLLEVIHPKAGKANAISELCLHLGIKQEEVMAIGDEENDYSMIEYAGVGVAMANGTSEIKKIAQYITRTNEEDGVAHAVTHFLKLNELEE